MRISAGGIKVITRIIKDILVIYISDSEKAFILIGHYLPVHAPGIVKPEHEVGRGCQELCVQGRVGNINRRPRSLIRKREDNKNGTEDRGNKKVTKKPIFKLHDKTPFFRTSFYNLSR